MRPTRERLGDIALVVALALIGFGGTRATDTLFPDDRPIDTLAFAVVLLTALSLLFRRDRPLIVLLVTTILSSAYLTFGYPFGPILVSFAVAVYTVARHRPLSFAGPAALVTLPVMLVHLLTGETSLDSLFGLIPGIAWVVVPFTIGVAVRVSRESTARQRAEEVRQGVYGERLRVAQEVHDVVGHGLAAIKMQADIALHLLSRKPEQAETALTAISRTSTEALDELRATLALVREADPGRPGQGTGLDPDADPGDQSGASAGNETGAEGAERSPGPGLARLDDLCRRMEQAGVRVDIETAGEPRALPARVDLVAYRVVQESLTNVLKHSDAKVATVRVNYENDAVVILISNPLAAAGPQRRGGLGIPGMRDRVTALGGDFTAEAEPDGRFQVRAVIPAGDAS